MALSEEYVKTQEHILGKEARKALDAIADYDLKVRTMLYSNLRACGSINGKYDASVIAQTIANILEARAWEDYVEVDGTRKSCDSFPKWLEICGIDINLAEYCVKEKRTDSLPAFYLARDGAYRDFASATVPKGTFQGVPNDQRKGLVSRQSSSPRLGNKTSSSLIRRMERDKDDPSVAEALSKVQTGDLTVLSAARTLGWVPPLIRDKAQSVVKNTLPAAKKWSDERDLKTEDFCKIAFHHALQTLTPELLEHYKEDLLCD